MECILSLGYMFPLSTFFSYDFAQLIKLYYSVSCGEGGLNVQN